MKISREWMLILGYGGILGGAWMLREAYERRGVQRPFLARFLP